MAVNRGYLKKRKNQKSDEVIGAQFVCYSHLPTLLAVKISSMDITKSTKDKQTSKQTNIAQSMQRWQRIYLESFTPFLFGEICVGNSGYNYCKKMVLQLKFIIYILVLVCEQYQADTYSESKSLSLRRWYTS